MRSFDYRDEKAFAVQGIRDRLFSRVQELRWEIEPPGGWNSCNDPRAHGCLKLTTTRHERYSMFRLSDDVIRITDDHYGTRRLLFRVGSWAHAAMDDFRECVKGNDGVALFKVKTCTNPLSVP